MTNCSYTASNGTFISLQCTNNCCTGSDVNHCSTTTCVSVSSNEDNLPVLFWGILGGLFGLGIIMIAITYVICRFRSPNTCMKIYSDDDIFDENSTSQRRRSSLFITKYFMRRESVWKLKTRRKSQLTVKMHGTHLSHASTSKTDDRINTFPQATLVKNGDINTRGGGGGCKNSSSMLPEVVD